MRIVNIDLSQDSNYPQNIFGGYAGEHKESKLVVSLPPRLITDDISYYYFEFQTAYSEHLSSPNIYKSELTDGNKISVELWEQLVPTEGLLKVCVTAAVVSPENEILIKGKTALVNLQILKSPSGNEVLINPDGTKEELQEAIDSCIDDAQSRGVLVGQKTSDKGEIFSTYTGDTANKALGEASSAFGQNNIAGCYGFKVVGFVKGSYNGSETASYAKVTLDTDEEHFNNIAVNDLVSVRINYNSTGLTVLEVDTTNKIVTLSAPLTNFPDYKASDNDYLWLVEKPEAGDTSIGIGAFAGGFSGNHANQDGSFAFGRNNIADGRFSVALGSGNKAGYNTFVVGKDNESLQSENSAMFGNKNKTTRYVSASIINGLQNTTQGMTASIINGSQNTTAGNVNYSIINGKSNKTDQLTQYSIINGVKNHLNHEAYANLVNGEGLRVTTPCQTVLGKYNKWVEDTLLLIGNGANDDSRVNAFEVYKDGHAELQTQGTTNKSIIINTKDSLNGLINKLDTGTATPQDNDYYISQYAGGGTTTTTYHRRPVSALYNYIKGKADSTVTSTSTNLVTSKAVDTAINTKLSSVYKPQGSVTFAKLPTTLTSAQEGYVYNISEEFTTTDLFIEGAGKTFPSGTNVVVVKEGNVYKYDVLAGMIDLTPYATKTELSGKLSKVTSASSLNRVYGINKDGTQTVFTMSSGADSGSVAIRTASGTVRVTTPTNANDATTKKYVDDTVGDINTILATLVDVTSTQSDEQTSDETVLSDETNTSDEPTI